MDLLKTFARSSILSIVLILISGRVLCTDVHRPIELKYQLFPESRCHDLVILFDRLGSTVYSPLYRSALLLYKLYRPFVTGALGGASEWLIRFYKKNYLMVFLSICSCRYIFYHVIVVHVNMLTHYLMAIYSQNFHSVFRIQKIKGASRNM